MARSTDPRPTLVLLVGLGIGALTAGTLSHLTAAHTEPSPGTPAYEAAVTPPDKRNLAQRGTTP
ncbi:hypothetical protein ACFFSW_06190 [Saccharothrix longispora]|uniref:Uncharacterized protein n=1 Tax=Saccharothrix longispora TaxID=33920 RepID=A0ABU1PTF9_9PSEU|nr:hypothetical protein [Saccharothrix longispora]MDR6593914.1 hypothetical protein [Saccharothrix longispora]